MNEIDYSGVIERLKKHLNVKGDSELARIIDVTPQAIYSFKKQNKFPLETLLKFCSTHDVSLDWLLFGRASVPSPAVDKITRWLREHPDDAETILKIIEGREAMEKLKKP